MVFTCQKLRGRYTCLCLQFVIIFPFRICVLCVNMKTTQKYSMYICNWQTEIIWNWWFFSCINPLLCKNCIVRTGKPQLFANVSQWNELKLQIVCACVCVCTCLCVHSPSLESGVSWVHCVTFFSLLKWSPFSFFCLSLQIPWFPDTLLFYFSLSLNILEMQKCRH